MKKEQIEDNYLGTEIIYEETEDAVYLDTMKSIDLERINSSKTDQQRKSPHFSRSPKRKVGNESLQTQIKESPAIKI